MDTSEQYIKMCEKAEEIQALKEPDIRHNYYGEHIDSYQNPPVWLPRQDQLQAMVKGKIILRDFCMNQSSKGLWKLFWKDYDSEPIQEVGVWGESMEQLWLAFVMKEKYQKVWDGDDWVKK